MLISYYETFRLLKYIFGQKEKYSFSYFYWQHQKWWVKEIYRNLCVLTWMLHVVEDSHGAKVICSIVVSFMELQLFATIYLWTTTFRPFGFSRIENASWFYLFHTQILLFPKTFFIDILLNNSDILLILFQDVAFLTCPEDNAILFSLKYFLASSLKTNEYFLKRDSFLYL